MGRSKPGLNFTVSLILTMSKLCLLVLGVLSIAALAAAWDHQEDTSLSEDLANSRLVRSPEAAAKKKRKNKPKRSGGKRREGDESLGSPRGREGNPRRDLKAAEGPNLAPAGLSPTPALRNQLPL